MASFIGIHAYMFYTYIQVTYGGALMENKLLAVGQREAGKCVLCLHAALYHGPESSITHASLGSAALSWANWVTLQWARAAVAREGRNFSFLTASNKKSLQI